MTRYQVLTRCGHDESRWRLAGVSSVMCGGSFAAGIGYIGMKAETTERICGYRLHNIQSADLCCKFPTPPSRMNGSRFLNSEL